MEANNEILTLTNAAEADVRLEHDLTALRELSSLELSLVGGGSGLASFV